MYRTFNILILSTYLHTRSVQFEYIEYIE